MKVQQKTEIELACTLIRVLDGIPIQAAKDALSRAQAMLLTTQTVRADSPLLTVADENDATFNRQD